MSASESKASSNAQSEARPYAPAAGVSMRDLLAAGAAANVISTPPRLPDPANREPADHGHRHAA